MSETPEATTRGGRDRAARGDRVARPAGAPPGAHSGRHLAERAPPADLWPRGGGGVPCAESSRGRTRCAGRSCRRATTSLGPGSNASTGSASTMNGTRCRATASSKSNDVGLVSGGARLRRPRRVAWPGPTGTRTSRPAAHRPMSSSVTSPQSAAEMRWRWPPTTRSTPSSSGVRTPTPVGGAIADYFEGVPDRLGGRTGHVRRRDDDAERRRRDAVDHRRRRCRCRCHRSAPPAVDTFRVCDGRIVHQTVALLGDDF